MVYNVIDARQSRLQGLLKQALAFGLGVVLTFVGVKMILAHTAWKIDTHLSLGVIVVILTASAREWLAVINGAKEAKSTEVPFTSRGALAPNA